MASQQTANRPLQGGFQDLGILAAIVATFLIGIALGNAVRPVSISDWFDDDTAAVSTTKPVTAHVPDLAGEGILQAQQEGVARQGPAALDDDPIVAHTPEMAGEGILQEQLAGYAAPLPLDIYQSLLERQQKLYEINDELYPAANASAVQKLYKWNDQPYPATESSAVPNTPTPLSHAKFLEQNLNLPTSGSVSAEGNLVTGQSH